METHTLDLTDQLVGKPVTVTVGGKRREIGVIDTAHYQIGRGINIVAEITDETLAGRLNNKALTAER